VLSFFFLSDPFSKGSEKKSKILMGRRGYPFFLIRRAWGRGKGILEFLQCKGVFKIFMPPVIAYGYFLESPKQVNKRKYKLIKM